MALENPTIGEIAMFAGNFAPRGWAFCSGQLLPINQNQALFSVIGTIYGGDGRLTVGLPDLRGRAPIHSGQGHGLTPRRLGAFGGQEVHTLNALEMPSHNHIATVTEGNATIPVNTTEGEEDEKSPANGVLANTGSDTFTSSAPNGRYPAVAPVSGTQVNVNLNGGSQAHNNMQPFLAINYIIALTGTFPSRS